MPRKHGQTVRPRNPEIEEPHSWDDLDKLGLARDHYYNLWLKTRCCGRCGNDHIEITWRYYGTRGWRFRCPECRQDWMETRCTPGMTVQAKKNLISEQETK
jgi:transposase-like protein